MFLSRLRLNPANRAVQRDLADCQQLHRTLMKAFPHVQTDAPARREHGVLYRLETPTQSMPYVLVQSGLDPDWSFLPAGYLAPGAAPECKSLARAYTGIVSGDHFRFRLRANPTRKISVDDASRPKGWRPVRVELRGEENWMTWLDRKGGQHGFHLLASSVNSKVPDLRTAAAGRTFGHRSFHSPEGGKTPSHLTLFSVLYEGRIEVTDPVLFREALAAGIGPGKSYGFGLLSVAREPDL